MKPTSTILHGDEIVVTDEMNARAFWLLRKYTSITYIRRMHDLLHDFIHGYEEYARGAGPSPPPPALCRDTLLSLYQYDAEIERGIEMIADGCATGYPHVATGVWFSEDLMGPQYEYGWMHTAIGYRKPPEESIGLFSWAERAIDMGIKVRVTLDAKWAYPQVFATWYEPFGWPAVLQPLPRKLGTVIEHREEVPTSGIWVPISIPAGCPNYLQAGAEAPHGKRASIRYDIPGEGPNTAVTRYEYEEQPTGWALLWADDRYRDGSMPEESEYLDERTQFPPYPPHP